MCCFIVTLVGSANVNVAAAKTKDESVAMKASTEQCSCDVIESKAVNVIESYAANTTTIVFDANGGKGTMEDGVVSDDYVLPKSKFKKSGYKFAGWSTVNKDPDPTNFYKVGTEGYYLPLPEGSTTLYAIWVKSKKYNISYDLGKGMKLSKSVKTYTSGKTTKLPSVKDSDEFNGWMFTINGQEYGPIFEIPAYMTGKIKLKPLMIGFEG
jgi:hypothetical protein